MSRRSDDAWLSDTAHQQLNEQAQQHMAAAQEAAQAAEAAAEQAAQLRDRGQK